MKIKPGNPRLQEVEDAMAATLKNTAGSGFVIFDLMGRNKIAHENKMAVEILGRSWLREDPDHRVLVPSQIPRMMYLATRVFFFNETKITERLLLKHVDGQVLEVDATFSLYEMAPGEIYATGWFREVVPVQQQDGGGEGGEGGDGGAGAGGGKGER